VVAGLTVVVVVGGTLPASWTVQRVTPVVAPFIVNVIVYLFTRVVAFALNLANRETVPVLHFTVSANPAIFGLDDQSQILAFLTVAVKVTEPPEALIVFVAAPAWETKRPPTRSAMQATLVAILRCIETS
jgi:hypothetical protein